MSAGENGPLIEGDKELAFEMLFRATYDRVLSYALRRADPADADDIVAETYTTAWRRFSSIPPEPLPWLYGVARKTLANARRSRHRRARLATKAADEQHTSAQVVAGPGERVEDAVLMRAALAALNEADREALMLVAWEGLNNRDASVVLDVTPEAFAVRLHRARRRLEAHIERLHEHSLSEDQAPSEDR